MYLNLINARQTIFNRILNSNNLLFLTIEIIQRAIERRRLTAAGGSRDQHHPVRLLDESSDPNHVPLLESAALEVQGDEFTVGRFLVEDTDNRVLAVNAGHDRNAEIDRPLLDAKLETAVLGNALLRDVELGHDLESRDDRRVEFLIDRLHRLVQRAVDAVLDQNVLLTRFDVNIGRPSL